VDGPDVEPSCGLLKVAFARHEERREVNPSAKGTDMKKLNIKAWELVLSDGNAECGKCHCTIPSGRPALLHRTVNVEEGELVVSELTECVRFCSELPARIEQLPAVRIERRKSYLPDIRREWEDLPDLARPEHQTRLPIYNLEGEKIATGYTSILRFTDDISFLECNESQVVTTMFKQLAGESDRYGSWVHMQTPSGFYGRKYLKSNGELLAGNWYFRLNLVRPGILEPRNP
jgi:hypothetical protein